MYVVGSYYSHLDKVLLMSTHNVFFMWRDKNIYPLILVEKDSLSRTVLW